MRLKGQNSSYDQSIKKSAANNKHFTNSVHGVSKGLTAVNGPLNGITGRFTALSSLATGTAGKIALVGAAFAAAGLAAASSLKTYSAYEVHQLKTAQLLEATGYAAGLNTIELSKNADAVALATLASVEGINEAQGVLLTFKSIQGETFREAIVLAQDMAAVFGGSASDKATQLGKALEDPVRGLTALKKSGVSATQSQKDLIKSLVDTGDAAEAQRVILKMLRDQVGGAGAAQAGGLAGSVDTLGQRWDELKVKWASTSGAAKSVQGWVDALAESFRKLGEAIEPSVDGLEKKISALEGKLVSSKKGNRRQKSRSGFIGAELAELRDQLAMTKAKEGDMDSINNMIEKTKMNITSLQEKVEAGQAKKKPGRSNAALTVNTKNLEINKKQLTDLIALQKEFNRQKKVAENTKNEAKATEAASALATAQATAQVGLDAVRKAQSTKTEIENMGMAERKVLIDEAFAAQLIDTAERDRLIEANALDHQKKLTDIQDKDSKKRIASESAAQKAAYSAIATSTDQFLVALEGSGQKRSALYKAMFVAQKAAAIPGMIASTEEGATAALKLGPIAGPPAAMGIRAMGYASIGLVAGQTIAGIAHGGMGYIPEESTYLLQKGEGVLSPKQNAEVQKMASEFNAGKSSAAPVTVNIIEDASRAGQVQEATGPNGEQMIEAFVASIQQGGPAADVMEQTYRLQRAGR